MKMYNQILRAVLVNVSIYCILTLPHLIHAISRGQYGFAYPLTSLIVIANLSAFSHLIWERILKK
jgi:hypothetical protein